MRGYNQSQYNVIQYLASGASLSFSESTPVSDATLQKLDAIVLNDFLFSDDAFDIAVSNKALVDTIIMNDWLTVKLNPAVNPWSD